MEVHPLAPASCYRPAMAAKKSATDSLRASIDGFVADLSSLFRDSILSAVAGGERSPSSRRTALIRSRGKGQKRDPKVIAALTSKLREFIAKNPGKRIEHIGHELSVSTKELVLSVKKLIAEKVISTRGQRRATTYFPAKASSRAPARATARKRKTKKKTTKKKAKTGARGKR